MVLCCFDVAVVTLNVVEVCDFFCLIFDFLFSSFCRNCLSLLLVVAGYVLYTSFALLLPLKIDHMFTWDYFDWFFFWSLLLHVLVLLFPISSYLFLFPPCCCCFFWSMPSTCVVRSFCRPCCTILNLERIIVSVVLNLQLETLRNCNDTILCFAYELVRCWRLLCLDTVGCNSKD